jgi:hypothetical protein
MVVVKMFSLITLLMISITVILDNIDDPFNGS